MLVHALELLDHALAARQAAQVFCLTLSRLLRICRHLKETQQLYLHLRKNRQPVMDFDWKPSS